MSTKPPAYYGEQPSWALLSPDIHYTCWTTITTEINSLGYQVTVSSAFRASTTNHCPDTHQQQQRERKMWKHEALSGEGKTHSLQFSALLGLIMVLGVCLYTDTRLMADNNFAPWAFPCNQLHLVARHPPTAFLSVTPDTLLITVGWERSALLFHAQLKVIENMTWHLNTMVISTLEIPTQIGVSIAVGFFQAFYL